MSKSRSRPQALKELVEDARSIGLRPEEVRPIHELLKRRRFPADVQGVEVRFGRDWIGAPAAWIEFLVEDDLHPSHEKITRLNKFTASVRDALLKTHPTYWPYVHFRATS